MITIIQGDFSYLPHYCSCPCHSLINLNKARFKEYERYGYPKFILGHNNYKRKTIYGDFEYLPHHCSCPCHEPIPLVKDRITTYENIGYPKFIIGHSNYVRETTNNEIQGDFEFLHHNCTCGCHGIISLSKKAIKIYEKEGYPKFIKGHNSNLQCSTLLMGDFEYLPRYCKNCGKEITLLKGRFRNYEKYGYPEHDKGCHRSIQHIFGDFEFIHHYCKHCGQEIPLRKTQFKYYERYGYPELIHGHKLKPKTSNISEVHGDFCFIPIFCRHCGDEISLSKKRIKFYEEKGYPEYAVGHITKSNIIISSDLFCFVPYKCKHCDEYIELDPKRIWWYEHGEYPEYIHRHNPTTQETKERLSTSILASLKNPEIVERRKNAQIKAHSPEASAKRSISMKAVWSNPEFHEEQVKRLNLPEYKKKLSDSVKLAWTRPEVKEKISGRNAWNWNEDRNASARKLKQKHDQLGWYSLNPIIGDGHQIIHGFERHHVNHNDVIYVPKEYNQDVIHRLETGYNMEVVNTMAYFFLLMNYIDELNKIFME